MHAARYLRSVPALFLSLMLAACGSSQTTRYHGLQPEGETASKPSPGAPGYTGPQIQITVFNTPAIFDRDEILKEVAPGQFEVQEFDHWAAPFTQMARQTFADDLSARLPAGEVNVPGSPVPAGAAQLAINLEGYRVIGGSAQLQATWSWRDTTMAPGGWQSHPVLLKADAGDGGGAATAAAINKLLAQLADQIAASLQGG